MNMNPYLLHSGKIINVKTNIQNKTWIRKRVSLCWTLNVKSILISWSKYGVLNITLIIIKKNEKAKLCNCTHLSYLQRIYISSNYMYKILICCILGKSLMPNKYGVLNIPLIKMRKEKWERTWTVKLVFISWSK